MKPSPPAVTLALLFFPVGFAHSQPLVKNYGDMSIRITDSHLSLERIQEGEASNLFTRKLYEIPFTHTAAIADKAFYLVTDDTWGSGLPRIPINIGSTDLSRFEDGPEATADTPTARSYSINFPLMNTLSEVYMSQMGRYWAFHFTDYRDWSTKHNISPEQIAITEFDVYTNTESIYLLAGFTMGDQRDVHILQTSKVDFNHITRDKELLNRASNTRLVASHSIPSHMTGRLWMVGDPDSASDPYILIQGEGLFGIDESSATEFANVLTHQPEEQAVPEVVLTWGPPNPTDPAPEEIPQFKQEKVPTPAEFLANNQFADINNQRLLSIEASDEATIIDFHKLEIISGNQRYNFAKVHQPRAVKQFGEETLTIKDRGVWVQDSKNGNPINYFAYPKVSNENAYPLAATMTADRVYAVAPSAGRDLGRVFTQILYLIELDRQNLYGENRGDRSHELRELSYWIHAVQQKSENLEIPDPYLTAIRYYHSLPKNAVYDVAMTDELIRVCASLGGYIFLYEGRYRDTGTYLDWKLIGLAKHRGELHGLMLQPSSGGEQVILTHEGDLIAIANVPSELQEKVSDIYREHQLASGLIIDSLMLLLQSNDLPSTKIIEYGSVNP